MENHSVLDFFSIGIGPSSSHTVGPMRAAADFVQSLVGKKNIARLGCDLYGSLAATGKGHGTDRALMLGFLGERPESVDVDKMDERLATIRAAGSLQLSGGQAVDFDEKRDLSFSRYQPLPRHPNGMHFWAWDAVGAVVSEQVVYSVGGGFVVAEGDWEKTAVAAGVPMSYPFDSAHELLELCSANNISIADLVLTNEMAYRRESDTRAQLDEIWAAMQNCVARGIAVGGALPGGLAVERRAQIGRAHV